MFDGVIADFIPAYQSLFVMLSGANLFEPNDVFDPPVWDWPTHRGYEEMFPGITKDVWTNIITNDNFWYSLAPMKGNVRALNMLVPLLEEKHEVYYITSRPGIRAKRQTEVWLYKHLEYRRCHGLGTRMPTVLVVGPKAKGDMAKHLGLDIYLDDNLDNVNDCMTKALKTRTYLLNRAYNQSPYDDMLLRVDSLGQLFDYEMANL